MGLWIRSQDKKILEKCEDLFSAYYSSKKSYAICSHKNMVTLGLYKTEERAKEILTDIQEIICLKDMYINDKQAVHESWKKLSKDQLHKVRKAIVVYEMPEE